MYEVHHTQRHFLLSAALIVNFYQVEHILVSLFLNSFMFAEEPFLIVWRDFITVGKYLFIANKRDTGTTSLDIPAGIYLLKVNDENTRTMCEICSKLLTKSVQSHWCAPGVFIAKFEQISLIDHAFPLLTLNK